MTTSGEVPPPLGDEVQRCIRAFTVQQGCEIDELNIQLDHVHLITMVPPKISISKFVGTVKLDYQVFLIIIGDRVLSLNSFRK